MSHLSIVGQALVAILDSPCIEHPSSKRPGVDSVPRADRCIGRCDRRCASQSAITRRNQSHFSATKNRRPVKRHESKTCRGQLRSLPAARNQDGGSRQVRADIMRHLVEGASELPIRFRRPFRRESTLAASSPSSIARSIHQMGAELCCTVADD